MAATSKFNSAILVNGTIYSTLQMKVFKLEFASALTEDSGGNGTVAITEGTFRKVMQELGTTAALFELHDDNDQTLIVIGDAHALDINTLAIRAGRIISSGGVLEGAGVWKASAGGAVVVTVTEPTSTRGL